MELTNIRAQRAYFDTNIFIYLLEQHPKYESILDALIQHLDSIGCEIVTSELTLAECLVKTFADGDDKSIDLYQQSLQNSSFLRVEPVSRETLVHAAEVRATLKNKLPDAIHVSTALLRDCDVFVCNDNDLKLPPSIQNIVLKDLVA